MRSTIALDPQNMNLDIDEIRLFRPSRLTRKRLNVLGNHLPVVQDREESNPTESPNAQNPHLPQASIINMARRGWELDEAHDSDNNARSQYPIALPALDLPMDDAALLQRWSPTALQRIMREQHRYFEHGLRGRNEMSLLDPIQQGLITEARSRKLYEA